MSRERDKRGRTRRALAEYRGRHAGQTVIVCGCGASLKDFDPPAGVVTIGVNDVGRHFDPTYLVVLNARNQFSSDRFRYVEQSGAEAVFSQLDLGIAHPRQVRFRLGKRGGVEISPPDRMPYTRNSPYVAVMLAAWMGAKRIGLIGVDFTSHHFFAATGTHRLGREITQIDVEYGRLRAALGRRDIELVNLSEESRLQQLPKVGVHGFLRGETEKTKSTNDHTYHDRIYKERRMRVFVERRHQRGQVAKFLDTFAASASRAGFDVDRSAGRGAGVTVVWNGRRHAGRGPTLYCEHGWLPRWEYQISTRGINADSHAAPFRWNGEALSDEQRAELEAHLAEVRRGGQSSREDMQTEAPALKGLPQDFILVPMQMEMDTNIVRHVPAKFRRMQALIDAISTKPCPYPVIFKQHPADARRGNRQVRLRIRRRRDQLWRHSRGNVYQLLKSGRCRGIVSLNSNVVHDGLLFDVPAVVLGKNIWPRKGMSPFLNRLPKSWGDLATHLEDEEVVACRESYAYYLMQHQWSMSDIGNPERVRELIEHAAEADVSRRRRRIVRSASVTDIKAARKSRPASSRPVKPRGRQQRTAPEPRLNVCVRRREWLFGDLAAHFASVSDPRYRVVVTDRPVQSADGWMFIRTREASAAPDPSRSVVQIHDNLPSSLYAAGAERACVRRCRGVVLTHPDQKRILRDGGVSLGGKQVLCEPPGALRAFTVREQMSERFSLAWVGRPAFPNGNDIKGIRTFMKVARALGPGLRVVLLGERLDDQHKALRRADIDCIYYRRADYPIERYPELYRGFDCVAITSQPEDGPPMPLFEALASGVPVVSTRAGWAPQLIRNEENGFLADDAEQMIAAVSLIRDDRERWFEQRNAIRESLGGASVESWIRASLELAFRIAMTGRAKKLARHA